MANALGTVAPSAVKVTSMTFDDEFNSFSASPDGSGTTWQDLLPYGGEAAHTLSGNNEAEYYSGDLTGSNSPFSDTDGILNMSAFAAAPGSNPYNLPYTSGVITTAQSFSQQYGYFEINAELPAGNGLWPAFWMLPTDGYTAELDDFEVVNNSNVVNSTTHGIQANGQWGSDFQSFPTPDLSTSFHTFGVDWEPNTVTYYLDGVAYGTAPTPTSMDSPMYMLLNLAVGGNGSWPGSPPASTMFPADMRVDWVRAYATANTVSVGGSAALPAGTPDPYTAAGTSAGTSTGTAAGNTSSGTTNPPAPAAPAVPPTVGSGPDTLTLAISEDAYQGDAQFTVSIDGVQQGGTLTAAALKSAGQTQDFTFEGTFAGASHTVTVDFLNDLFDGTASTDRNLYVGGASINGASVANSSMNEYSAGPQSFSFTEAAAPVAPAATDPAGVTVGSGPDQLVLQIAEDAYQGDAQFTINVNGVQQGGTQTATAIQGLGETQAFTVDGTFPSGNNTVTVDFINDLFDGTASTDRNLFVDSATINGSTVPGAALNEWGAGPQSFAFTSSDASSSSGTTTAPATNQDTVTVNLSEDAHQGDAIASIAIDGRTLGSADVTFLNSSDPAGGAFSFTGDFGGAATAHTLSVSLTNADGGAADRNLYVKSASFDGISQPDQGALYSNGALVFAIPPNPALLVATQQS